MLNYNNLKYIHNNLEHNINDIFPFPYSYSNIFITLFLIIKTFYVKNNIVVFIKKN